MLLHKSYINVAIANILLYGFTLYDLPEPNYKKFDVQICGKRFLAKISFCALILGRMLLHKRYINVVKVYIFLHSPALKNLRRLRYKQFAENT